MKRDRFLAYQIKKPVFCCPKPTLKNRIVKVIFFQENEYLAINRGRCISYRSRGKMSSIVLRSKPFTTEQRIFVNSPRLIVKVSSWRGWDSNPRTLRLWFSKPTP